MFAHEKFFKPSHRPIDATLVAGNHLYLGFPSYRNVYQETICVRLHISQSTVECNMKEK